MIPCEAMHLWHDFLDSVTEESPGKPFLAVLTPEIPHGTSDAPRAYFELYRDLPLRGFENDYYPTITWLDEVVFEILQAPTACLVVCPPERTFGLPMHNDSIGAVAASI